MQVELLTPISNFIPQLIDELTEVKGMRMIVHPASWNWRQKNLTINEQIENLKSGLTQTERPIVDISRSDLINRYTSTIDEITTFFSSCIPNTVVSLCSKVITKTKDSNRHIPMMNYHPEGVNQRSSEGLDRISEFLKLFAQWEVFIFQTDRYWHSYANTLLNQNDWYSWLGLHANATSIVSPRYIGQSLRDGYTPLRQVGIPDSPVKNFKPILLHKVNPNNDTTIWEYQQNKLQTSSSDLKFGKKWRVVGRNGNPQL